MGVLSRGNRIYDIYHKQKRIGCLSGDFTEDIWKAIKMTGRRDSIPPRLTGIYVKNIVAVVPYSFPDNTNVMYKESNFWLGIELTGFAKADWHWEGN